MKNNLILFIFGICLMLTFGCKHEALYPLANLSSDSLRFKTISCNKDSVYFYNDIGPLIISNCAMKGCHDGNSGNSPTLTNYSSITKLVVPGQLDQSKLYSVLTATGGNKMPLAPMSPFSTAQLQMVAKWIQQGAANNGCLLGSAGCDTTNVTYANSVIPIFQTYCTVCHGATSYASSGGGFKIATYADFASFAKSGLLMNSINQVAGLSAMPKGGSKLSACDISKIRIVVRKIVDSLVIVACDTTKVTYPATIFPLLQTNCNACHSAATYASLGGGFRISTYPDFSGFARSGLLMNSINQIAGLSPMPKGGNKLSACDISKFRIAVRKIVDSLNLVVCDTTNVTFPVTILPILQAYCLACHSTANAPTLGGGYKLEALADFTAVSRTGLLMNSINQIAGLSAMPKGGSKLSACNITKLGIMTRLVKGVTPTPPPVYSCSPDTVYFTNSLGPLIVSSCALTGCHNGAGQSPTLLTYANIRNSVVPGNPASSRLYTVLNSSGENSMPRSPVAPFTAAQKIVVFKWIQQGALNNACLDATCDTTTVTYSATVAPILTTNCIGCHSSSGSSTTKLDSYTAVKAAVTAKRISGAIQHLSGYVAMPPGGTLSTCDINKIKAWIYRGALNN